MEAFRQGLRDLGYIETKNILVEYRYLEGKSEVTPRLVGELVQLKVDVLVLGPQPAIRAAKQATKSIPIVMVTSQDPVAAGFVSSLARPGGSHGAHQTDPRVKRQTAGVAEGSGSRRFARRCPFESDTGT